MADDNSELGDQSDIEGLKLRLPIGRETSRTQIVYRTKPARNPEPVGTGLRPVSRRHTIA